MLKSLKHFVVNDGYSINIWNGHININNFSDIVILEDTRVVLLVSSIKIVIKGNNICIK